MKFATERIKLIIADLDGTLVDTKDVNYQAYREAIKPFGYELDYRYYCEFCNGRHYLDFLPQITTQDKTVLAAMHKAKKAAYSKYLEKAILNQGLVDIINALKRTGYKAALVTTASKQNCEDLIQHFKLSELFDLVLTHEDIEIAKPDPQGFLKAMSFFHAEPRETVIFEDSDVGLEAARRSGAFYYKTIGFN